jgi:uncharacterized caspase-like protein
VFFVVVVLVLAPAAAGTQSRDVVPGPTSMAALAGYYPNSWALVVGIDAYQHAPQLNHAVADAKAVAATLSALGFPTPNIRRLFDGQATRRRILEVLHQEFAGMGPNDRLLVFFAGRAARTPTAKQEEEAYLLPVDADPGSLAPTAISMDELRRVSGRVAAKHVLFILDACLSGLVHTRGRLDDHRLKDFSLETALQQPAVQIITSCRAGDVAVGSQGLGAFTRALLDGLRGAADTRGVVTASTLAAWLQPRVARDSNGRMIPTYASLGGGGDFFFVSPGPLLPPVSRVTAPAPVLPPPVGEPPRIVLSYPTADSRVDREQIPLVGLVTAKAGIRRVQVAVNSVEVPGPESSGAPQGVPIQRTIALLPGENVIAVTAADVAGNFAQMVRLVTRPVPTPAPTASSATAPGERWAVIIGVGKYEDAGVRELRYAVADAEMVYQTLIGPGGFKKENVILLTDGAERKPTLRNVKWALGTMLARSARKQDTAVIYFAGHGAPEIDPRGRERDGLAKYLIPSDADSEDLYSTALPMDELQTIFSRIEADRIVAFFDTCYSGAAGGRTLTAPGTRQSSVDDLFLDRLTQSKGRAIITASRSNEVSVELDELGHGLFTYYLVRGLRGAADLDRDGIVTFQELYRYVEPQVVHKSRSVGANQHPVLKGELEGDVPLTKTSDGR